MKFKSIPLGDYEENCYIVWDEESKEIAVIDPGDSGSFLIKEIEGIKGKLKYILLTHCHADHTGGVSELTEYFKAPVYINEKDEELIGKGQFMCNKFNAKGKADGYLKEGDIFKLGSAEIKCIETPGHTPGGMCFYIEDSLFSGDTLFAQSIGRTDFEGGDFSSIIASIKTKLFVLPENTDVYPGHGNSTSVGFEKKNNPFVLMEY